MTNKEKKLILAMAIGDGCLTRTSKTRSCLKLAHCKKQLPYLIWKSELINKAQGKITKVTSYLNKQNNTVYYQYRSTTTRNEFTNIRNFLYINNRKSVFQKKVLNRLDSLGLFIWWLDDGNLYYRKNKKNSVVGHYLTIGTTYKSREEAMVVQNYFKTKWGVNWRISKVNTRNFYYLRCGTKEGRKFMAIIAEHKDLVPCMTYKIDEKLETHIIRSA